VSAAMATETESPAIDLLDGDFYAGDPYPTYAWLREHAPLYHDTSRGLWGVSRYHDIVAIEKDAARYTSSKGSRPLLDMSESMINMDDPQHQRQRAMVLRQFTPRAVKALEDDIRAVVTELIDHVCTKGYCDVVADLAAPLPAIMIGRKIGYPIELWPKVVWWSTATMQGGGGPHFHTAESMAAINDWGAVTWGIIQERKAEPKDDLISVWCHKEVETDDGPQLLPESEIFQETLLVLDGGAETTRSVIGTTCLALMARPEQRQILLDQPSVLRETGVEEFIRWATPVLNMRRTVTEAHELHGHQLTAGDQLLLMYSSANRDPEVFTDPESFDVTRAHNHHVAFGFGTHFCLGASLARLEIAIMFEELLRRLPDMRLRPYADPRYNPSAFARGLKDLHVEFTPTDREGDGSVGLFA
jgi:cholest-4-en-3-one 26-monooxygenase